MNDWLPFIFSDSAWKAMAVIVPSVFCAWMGWLAKDAKTQFDLEKLRINTSRDNKLAQTDLAEKESTAAQALIESLYEKVINLSDRSDQIQERYQARLDGKEADLDAAQKKISALSIDLAMTQKEVEILQAELKNKKQELNRCYGREFKLKQQAEEYTCSPRDVRPEEVESDEQSSNG